MVGWKTQNKGHESIEAENAVEFYNFYNIEFNKAKKEQHL